jgi:GMP reductase
MNIPIELSYKDVYLYPQKTIVESRTECDTSVSLGKFTFDMPIYPANMKTVVDVDTCKLFAKKNWFYTMHRFGIDNVAFTQQMHEEGMFSSISIGVRDKGDDILKFKNILDKPDFITIDISNGWAVSVEPLIKLIKDTFPESFLIVGNISTSAAINDLEKWGADACKVGQSFGKVCTTRLKTGFARPMVSALTECSRYANTPIIADGNISEHGDIAKALSCGATMVMAGSLFSGYDESAGSIIEIDGKRYKEYFGSASEHNKGEYKNVEGKKILVDYKGSILPLFKELKEDLQSAISYSGGKTLSSFHEGLLFQIR